MNSHLRQYDISVPANGGSVEDIVGSFFEVLQSSGPIRVKTQNGLDVDLLPGQGVENFPFHRLEFVDRTGGGNTVRIVAGGNPDQVTSRPRFIDLRAIATDPGKDIAQGAFAFGGAVRSLAVAAQYSRAQIFNVGNNPRNLVVPKIVVWSDVLMVVGIRQQIGGSGTVVANGINKLTNNPSSLAVIAYDSSATIGGIATSNANECSLVPPDTPIVIQPKVPWVVKPNSAIMVWGDVLNQAFSCSFEWFEV